MKNVFLILIFFIICNNFSFSAVDNPDIQTSYTFYAPIGDRNLDISSKLKWDYRPNTSINHTWNFPGFNGTLDSDGWYVFTNFNTDKDYLGNWYNSNAPYAFHPGEDWNGNGGGNTDIGQPVYPCASGKVIYIQNITTQNTFGKMIQIIHRLTSSEFILSVYAHLDEIFVNLNDPVSINNPIGTVGSSGTETAHLHFEIRKQTFLIISTNSVSLKNEGLNYTDNFNPNAWPGTNSSFISANYYCPSEFILSHQSANSSSLVGHFQDGWHDDGISQAFLDTFQKNGGVETVGNPIDDSNGRVHAWGDFWTQDFTGGSGGAGIIMYNPAMQTAFWIHGGIYNQYKDYGGTSMGPENLGVPISEESNASISPFGTTGRYQNFSKDNRTTAIELITSGHKKDSVYVVLPGIFEEFKNQGYSGCPLGFPISQEYDLLGENRQDFEGGYILWNINDGARSYFHSDNTAEQFSFSFSQGLNLFSSPFQPIPSRFSELFKSLGGDLFSHVFYLDQSGIPRSNVLTSLEAIPKTGYFLFLNNPRNQVVQGTAVDTRTILHQGINLVGVTKQVVAPFNNDVYPYAFYIDGDSVIPVNIFENPMKPGIGYFVFSDCDNNTLIPSSYTGKVIHQRNTKSLGGLLSPKPRLHNALTQVADFTAGIHIEQSGAQNSVELLWGFKTGATDGWDEGIDSIRDIPLPGTLIGYFNESFGLKKSLKSEGTTKEWPLAVVSQSKGIGVQDNLNPVQISWTIPSSGTINYDARFQLIDVNTNNVVIPDMLAQNQYIFPVSTPGTSRRFRIKYFKEESIETPINTVTYTPTFTPTFTFTPKHTLKSSGRQFRRQWTWRFLIPERKTRFLALGSSSMPISPWRKSTP